MGSYTTLLNFLVSPPMSPNKRYSPMLPSSLQQRRTPMACSKCRHRKVKCIPDDRLPGRRCRRCSDRKLHCVYISISEESLSPRISPSEDQVLQPVLGVTTSTIPTVPRSTSLHTFDPSSPRLGEGPDATTPYHVASHPLDSSHNLAIYADYGGNTYPSVERSFPQQNRSTHGARANPLSSQAATPWLGQVSLYSPYETPAAFEFNSDNETAGDVIYYRDPVYNGNYTEHHNLPSQGIRCLHHSSSCPSYCNQRGARRR